VFYHAPPERPSTSNDVLLSAAQPNTLPPSTSGATDRSVRPRRRVCMKFSVVDEEDNAPSCRPGRAEGASFRVSGSWADCATEPPPFGLFTRTRFGERTICPLE